MTELTSLINDDLLEAKRKN
jgi:hypothetical protein